MYVFIFLTLPRLDSLLESYYGPELYNIYHQRQDPTERWLKEAYREHMEEYKNNVYGEGENKNTQERGVFGELERNYGEDWDWVHEEEKNLSDEDVLLGYLINKVEEVGEVGSEELRDVFMTISRSYKYQENIYGHNYDYNQLIPEIH